MHIASRIVHDAGGVVVVNKPAGLPSTGRDLNDKACLQAQLMDWTRKRVWAVHQLDADTTGLNVFVRRKSLVATWQRLLKFPRGRKTYVAIVHGCVERDRFKIDQPLGWSPKKRSRGVIASGKRATSRVSVLARSEAATAVSVTLETGRTHQVRLHLAHVGHPLFGEGRYRVPACDRMSRHALHAQHILIRGDAPMQFFAPVPDDMIALAEALGLDCDGLLTPGAPG